MSWALDLEHLVMFKTEISQRTGRYEEREAFGMRPGRKGPLPPATHGPDTNPIGAATRSQEDSS